MSNTWLCRSSLLVQLLTYCSIVDGVLETLHEPTRRDDLDQLREEQKTLTKEIERLTAAIAAGGDIPTLVEAVKARQSRRDVVSSMLSMRSAPPAKFNRKAIEAAVRDRLTEWRQLLTNHVEDGRQLLREVLTEPLRFIPERKTYKFEGKVGLEGLLAGAVPLHLLVRPQRAQTSARWPGLWSALRDADAAVG